MSSSLYAGYMGGLRAATLAAAVVSGVVASALAMLPQLQFAHRGTLLHVALETAAMLIALLAGFLTFGRLCRHGCVNDVLLACALAVLVLLNLSLLTTPALARSPSKDLMVWILLIGRSLGAILFALAAFAPRRQWRRPGLVLAASVAGGSVAVLLTAAMLHGFAGYVAYRLAATLAPDSPRGPSLGGHPALLTLQLATAVLYAMAAVGFLRRSRRFGDEFLGWLAIASALAAFAHLNYSLVPITLTPSSSTTATSSAFALTRPCSSARCGRSGHIGMRYRQSRCWRNDSGSPATCMMDWRRNWPTSHVTLIPATGSLAGNRSFACGQRLNAPSLSRGGS